MWDVHLFKIDYLLITTTMDILNGFGANIVNKMVVAFANNITDKT